MIPFIRLLTIKLHINYLKNPHKSYVFTTYTLYTYHTHTIYTLILIKSLIIFLKETFYLLERNLNNPKSFGLPKV